MWEGRGKALVLCSIHTIKVRSDVIGEEEAGVLHFYVSNGVSPDFEK